MRVLALALLLLAVSAATAAAAPSAVTVTSPAAVRDLQPTVTGTAYAGVLDAPTVHVVISSLAIDGAGFAADIPVAADGTWTTGRIGTALAEGTYDLTVSQLFSQDAHAASSRLVVDLTAPTVTISPAGPILPFALGVLYRPGAKATFGASESGVTFACAIDGAFTSCTSPWTLPVLAPGQHALGVRPTDAAGNVGPVATQLIWSPGAAALPGLMPSVPALVPVARAPQRFGAQPTAVDVVARRRTRVPGTGRIRVPVVNGNAFGVEARLQLRAGGHTLASTSVRLAPNARRQVPLTLGRTGRRLVRRSRGVHAQLRLRLTDGAHQRRAVAGSTLLRAG